MLPAFVQI